MYCDRSLFGPWGDNLGKRLRACQHIFLVAYAGGEYYSLVDRRWRDFIHWTNAVSA